MAMETSSDSDYGSETQVEEQSLISRPEGHFSSSDATPPLHTTSTLTRTLTPTPTSEISQIPRQQQQQQQQQSTIKYKKQDQHFRLTHSTPVYFASFILLIILLYLSFISDNVLSRNLQYLLSPNSSLSPIPSNFPASSLSSTSTIPYRLSSSTTLIYWKPHKTGSTSMRSWLRDVAKILKIPFYKTGYYPYSKIVDHYKRIQQLNNKTMYYNNDTNITTTCNIFSGHVRVQGVLFHRPIDERVLGAVVTTTRHAFHTLASKFFHRTATSLNSLSDFINHTSEESQRWKFYFHDINPCEALSYYDGIFTSCQLHTSQLVSRIVNIANRIDCVVDTDDPEKDLNALCEIMNVIECPRLPNRNVKEYRVLYDQLYEMEHIKQSVQVPLYVTQLLRQALMQRRCRFMVKGKGILPQDVGFVENPKWPSTRCKNVNENVDQQQENGAVDNDNNNNNDGDGLSSEEEEEEEEEVNDIDDGTGGDSDDEDFETAEMSTVPTHMT